MKDKKTLSFWGKKERVSSVGAFYEQIKGQ
jgi:hypothetical protein